MDHTDLDAFDRQILALLKTDARRTGAELSAEVGLSAAACLRRLQRLRRIGAIEREVAIVSRAFEPEVMTAIVLLEIDRHNPQRIDVLTRRLVNLEEVERIFSITGDNDLALIVRCPSMEAFADFCETHFYEPPVAGYESLVVFREFRKEAAPAS